MTPYEKGLQSVKNKLILRGVLLGAALVAGIIAMAVAAIKTPLRVTDKTTIYAVRQALVFTLACDIITGLCLLGAVYLILDTAAMLIRNKTSSVKVYKQLKDPGNPYLKPDRRCAGMLLKSILIYLLALGAAGLIMAFSFCEAHAFLSTGKGDFGLGHLRNTLYKVAVDEGVGSTKTTYIDELEFKSCPVPLFDKLGTEKNAYWITAEDGTRLPVTVLDKSVLTSFWEKNRKRREHLLKIKYYRYSGLIESYEFVADRRDMESFDLPQVELKSADDLTVTRPADMSQYGELAWAVEKDGELLHGEGVDDELPYTLKAESDSFSIMENSSIAGKDMVGTYTVTLVKIYTYPGTVGTDEVDTEVLPVSDTVTFTIAGGEDIIKALGDEKIELAVDEKNFKVTLPSLPDTLQSYSTLSEIYFAAELSGRLILPEFGSDPYIITHSYVEGQTIDLPVKSAHYKLYAYVLDDNGEPLIISKTAEFDYMSEEDAKAERERAEKLEYFEPMMKALENHDTAAIKAMFAKNVIKNNADIDTTIEKIFDIYKGGRINTDTLYPYTEKYTSPDGKTQECYGNLWITTDEGTDCRIDISTCYKNGDLKDNVGVTYFSISDGKTFETVTIR